ncbi:aminopeptidase N C-terminal domain-containing protein [Parasphingorhabdus sp.]|uniref:aminopeptidase N C-terminal domain-containing protein n=1 Tax=Parasphingorhabdus sp. TaxID=2709688 RepID=UPI0032ED27FD
MRITRVVIKSSFWRNFKIAREEYRFVCDEAKNLDETMPMLAAQLISPLLHWQRYAMNYSTPMRSELERLLESQELSHRLRSGLTRSLKPN